MGDLAQSAQFTVGEWTVEPTLGHIRRVGQVKELEPRVMDLLVHLAENAGETVSTDELVSAVWAGRAVTDQPVYQGIAQLRKALEDDSRQPRYIVTVTKKGYRLIAAINTGDIVAETGTPRRRPLLVPVMSLFLAGSYFLLSSSDISVSRERPATALEAGSIAILPFVDMSEDQGHQYLGDGIAEELIHRIATDSDIRVVARTSSFSFRERDADVQAIGRRLGADVVLEGSVRRSGDRVRVTAQLIDVADGYHIWSQSYEHFLTDTFVLQDQIAASVAEVLQMDTGGGNANARSFTHNADAANAYYLGLYHMHKRRPDSLDMALQYLRQAVDADPEFALAWAGLSKAYFLASRGRFGRLDDAEAMQLSHDALRRAESLNPALTEVLELLADEALEKEDVVKAESLHLQAIEASPSSSTAFKAYGMTLFMTGRLEEALAARREAVSLDPLSPILRINLGRSYMSLHRLEEAEAEIRTAIELDPAWHTPYWALAEALSLTGRFAESIDIGQKALAIEGPDARRATFISLGIAYDYLTLGDFRAAEKWLLRGEELGATGWSAANQRIHWLLAQDRFDEADSLLTFWTQQEPDFIYVFLLGGLYRTVMEQNDAAIAMFETALAFPPDTGESHVVTTDFFHWGYLPALHLAYLYRVAGATDKAGPLLELSEGLLTRTEQRNMKSPGIYYVRASLSALRGDRSAALASIRLAINDGWSKLWFLERDPIFADYRGTPEFEAVLDELRTRLVMERQSVEAIFAAD
ncbi:MAG: winged helix-turn-helix domain-containing protein [Woeseiaceae bacterium]